MNALVANAPVDVCTLTRIDASGVPLPATVTEPEIAPPDCRAKFTFVVVMPTVTEIGVPLVGVQKGTQGMSSYSSFLNPRLFDVRAK